MLDHQTVANFLQALRPVQLPWLPHPALLSFLATTAVPGSHPSVALAWLAELAPGPMPSEMSVRLRGALPRVPLAGESVTVSISRYQEHRGFQIKSAALKVRGAEPEVYELPGRGELLLHGKRAYTTHHGPYDLNSYERIPFDEVRQTAGAVGHAVVAVGPEVNVSPRHVWHHELCHGRLVTYHGDGLAMKTFRNLAVNKASVRLVFDLVALRGYALFGVAEEIPGEEAPAAHAQVCAGFTALGQARPARIWRHVADRIEPVAVAAA
jgi:hypothetical protein